jgi:hypothetical protein
MADGSRQHRSEGCSGPDAAQRILYQAGSRHRPRRAVAKSLTRACRRAEWHRGKLFLRVGFIATNMSASPEGTCFLRREELELVSWRKPLGPMFSKVMQRAKKLVGYGA